jgi:SAM-dependent methyltransferase
MAGLLQQRRFVRPTGHATAAVVVDSCSTAMQHAGVSGPMPVPHFRADLYQGTAEFYDRFRPPYPDELFVDLRARLPITGTGRLLDLACGTGQVAFPLAGGFVETVAIDLEPETVAFAQAKDARQGPTGITWSVGAAETVADDGTFELITIGTAFHRLDRVAVAQRMRELVAEDGGVALLWSPVPSEGEEPWQHEMRQLIVDWTSRAGVAERIPVGWQEAMAAVSHGEVLERIGFSYDGRFEFRRTQAWTRDSLIGFLYSTSILSRAALGAATDAFEADTARRLASFTADGTFRCEASYAYELARPR